MRGGSKGKLFIAENYVEAVGIMTAIKEGIALSSVSGHLSIPRSKVHLLQGKPLTVPWANSLPAIKCQRFSIVPFGLAQGKLPSSGFETC